MSNHSLVCQLVREENNRIGKAPNPLSNPFSYTNTLNIQMDSSFWLDKLLPSSAQCSSQA